MFEELLPLLLKCRLTVAYIEVAVTCDTLQAISVLVKYNQREMWGSHRYTINSSTTGN